MCQQFGECNVILLVISLSVTIYFDYKYDERRRQTHTQRWIIVFNFYIHFNRIRIDGGEWRRRRRRRRRSRIIHGISLFLIFGIEQNSVEWILSGLSRIESIFFSFENRFYASHCSQKVRSVFALFSLPLSFDFISSAPPHSIRRINDPSAIRSNWEYELSIFSQNKIYIFHFVRLSASGISISTTIKHRRRILFLISPVARCPSNKPTPDCRYNENGV